MTTTAVRLPQTVAEQAPAAGTRPKRRGPGRLAALDGLRGVAAMVVVIHHLLLIAEPHLTANLGTAPWSLWWVLERTPLKLLTAGREAVMVFFVLSGLVVALPAMRKANFSWSGFLAGRFIRLFLPAWAAIVLATGLLFLVPRTPQQVTAGSWLAGSAQTNWNWQHLIPEYSLMMGSVQYDNALWTLRWEFAFSLVLPAFLVLAMALHRWWFPVGALTLGVAVLGGYLGNEAMPYLPVFFLGTLVAARLPQIRAWGKRPHAGWVFGTILVVSALVLVCSWLLAPVIPQGTKENHALLGLEIAGALGIVVVTVGEGWFRRLLKRRVPQFLGRTSFSLYLIHIPIITTLAWLLGDWNWPILFPIGITAALLGGWLFFRFIEKPLHRLARTTNRRAVALVAEFSRARD
ncbi:acyltransferase [Amnibacterium sp.]|uniref:acyltransferase family protein n=1 Tax=Amnibacterium sp. TaxID=1872496 RepID=UPI0026215C78|nr:acyltransferase [Amnibacterium sp.]MCU1474862.1 acyltransferase [Amnibacterium sp.]